MDDRPRTTENEATNEFSFREKYTPGEKLAPHDPQINPTSRPKSRLRPMLLLIIAALIAYATYRLVTSPHAPPESTRALQHSAALPVGAATIGQGDINVVVNQLGTVTPLANITVKTQVNGQLLEVGFKEGQIVKKGDFLAQIDPRPFQLSERQLEGQLVHDQGLLDQAQLDLTRFQTLVKQESIARQQAEDQAFLVKQSEGSVKSDQAQIDTQKLNLIYARIVSPIDGRVGLRLVDAGNYVQTTDAGLAVVTQLHPISVIFTVPEDYLPEIMAQMKAGQSLEVTIYDRANINRLAVGKVTNLDNQIDTTTGTVKLRAEFDNLDDALFPNQFVNARLLIKTLNNVVTAPATAIQRGAPGTFVYLINADGTVSVRPVQLGPQDGAMTAVTSGLVPGDRVVVDGADRLRDGAKVSVPAANGDAAASAQGAPAEAKPEKGRRGDRARQQSAP
ncbi:MAG: efflux RND transporter periplasmic adaptor subunit [Methylocella sp.]